MTAIVLPDIDRSTLEDLKKRMPTLHLSEIELPSMDLPSLGLPSMDHAGRQAERAAGRAVDRLLGRSRPSILPWLAAAIGIAAIVGTAAALLTWYRKPGWLSRTSDAGSGLPGGDDTGIGVTSAYGEAAIAGTTETGFGAIAFGTDAGMTSFEAPQP